MPQMRFFPQDWAERSAGAVGLVGHQVREDLGRFKTFIEGRGEETGAWRGEIPRQRRTG